ncbi:putative methyltransferase [Saccharothrix tamanrassetensis]|uniref:Putative methyltransferase n=1 Tax=Saccharothrix tamanrassetensis TaxID=1051531 RepID=A0A841CW82_9PSEU|nr:hypothetical protein [Saccharothrix tamanrassetensis]MBB5960277.1 putative methyltransferase [Saccharothrix tamanrassetensis]
MKTDYPAVAVMASVAVAKEATVKTRTDMDEHDLYVVFDGDPMSFELTLSREVAAVCVAQFSEALRELPVR